MSPRRSVARRALSSLGLVAFILVAVAWVLVLRPQALGGPATYVVIRGDSMVPHYATGDLVILHSATSYRVGDVVAYRVPNGEIGAGVLVIHRIIGGDAAHGFTVKGDNNKAPDPWRPRQPDIAGSAWMMIPDVGKAIVAVRSPVTIAALAAGFVVAVVLFRLPLRKQRRDGMPLGAAHLSQWAGGGGGGEGGSGGDNAEATPAWQ